MTREQKYAKLVLFLCKVLRSIPGAMAYVGYYAARDPEIRDIFSEITKGEL